MSNEFSVCQFANPKLTGEEFYEYVRRYVSAEEAVKAFEFYTNNVAARMGMTARVIITDGGDCVCAEWKFDEGLVFPTQEDLDAAKLKEGD